MTKILGSNIDHDVLNILKSAFEDDKYKLKLYTELLYKLALIIKEPVEFINNIGKLMYIVNRGD